MKKSLLVMMLVATNAFANPRFDDYYTVKEGEAQPASSHSFSDPVTVAHDLFSDSEEFFSELRTRLYSLLQFDHHNESYGDVTEPYNRAKHFGGWLNDRRDEVCYNTRAKVLIRDSESSVGFSSNGCSVVTGKWQDPYGDRSYARAGDIQIDHFVPLKNAYISGAYKWSQTKRCLYGNFLGNDFHLLAVYGKENASKSDKTPEGYMPPNTAYRCQYLVQWLKVKMIWSLGLTPPEKERVLDLVQENRCDVNQFVYSASELADQRQFMLDNLAMCQ